ncbi:uncharacterized protein LOC123317834 [Coccinella septempunctata]|uniref:uncharacterized protein LOC123317834 n=1 Tax=Coccinella septempunctata TaxID=41139 RepID=UPI001D05D828|nr:uncharacterized protein LOC123317834 [Coccinella septempunctata]
MAALLLFARDNISVTDKECAWNKSKQSQEKNVKKLRDMYPAKPHRSTDRNLTEEEIKVFKNKLSVFDGAVGFSWLLADEISSEESFIINVEDILFSQEYLIAQNRTEFFEDKIKLEENDANKIAELTIGQSENAKWLLARKNRLTASNFAVVLAACSRQRYPPSLFKRLSGAYNLENIKAIQWGKLHEKKGIEALEEALGVEVIPTGLWLDKCGFLGASPDGFIGEDQLVEVKLLMTT